MKTTIDLLELILISAGSILIYALLKTIYQTIKNKQDANN